MKDNEIKEYASGKDQVDRWWATFNAVLGCYDQGAAQALSAANRAHGFTPDSYKGG